MQKIAILYDASQAVLSTFDLDEVLRQIIGILRDYFQLQHVAIVLLEPETQELRVRSHSGWSEQSENTRLTPGVGLIGSAAQLKRPIYAPDVSKDPRYIMSEPSTRSELAIPLMVRDQVVGVLDCQSNLENFFDPQTIDLLTLFSTQASIALQNAQLYSLEQRRASQLEAINAIANQTTAVLDIRELLNKVCSLMLEAFPVDHVIILLREDDSLVMRAHEGKLTPRFAMGGSLPPETGLCGRAVRTGKPVLENDVLQAPEYIAAFAETRSEMCLPMISFGQTLGVMALESTKKGAFQESDLKPLESVAGICANAIQNAHYFERVRQLAYIDGLTGIFNRRFFEMRIVEELERAHRYTGTLSVLMVDIDHFKKLNDEFGHLLGDEVLRQVSSVFAQQLRKVDVTCRYGGDELAILLPETTGDAAMAVGEKLRRMVEVWPFPGVPRPVTISIGVADYPHQGTSRDELVKAADSALYAAKQAGRNRLVRASSAQSAV